MQQFISITINITNVTTIVTPPVKIRSLFSFRMHTQCCEHPVACNVFWPNRILLRSHPTDRQER